MSSPTRRRTPGVAGSVGLDIAAVVLFVAIGRRSHDEGSALAGFAGTATPFLAGLAFAWLLARAWRRPTRLATGLLVWPLTVLVGMLVRRWAFEDGTAPSFVVVATLFLGATLVGWRALSRRFERPPVAGGSLR